jgi:hypothetical protein
MDDDASYAPSELSDMGFSSAGAGITSPRRLTPNAVVAISNAAEAKGKISNIPCLLSVSSP